MPTKKELELQVAIDCHKEEERSISDKKYAKIMVERVVYALLSLVFTGFLIKLISMTFQNYEK
jgi:cell division protein FtsL